MDKNDFTDSLFRKVITELRNDIKSIETKSNGSIIEQLNEKVSILEKIMAVSVMKSSGEESDAIPVQDVPVEPGIIPDRYVTDVELTENNGRNGKPTWVAVDGIVYDVSNNSLWSEGIHFGNISGRDLSVEYGACHAGRPRLNKLPIVGKLVISNRE
jgi:predicted heme/steroid binding protein